MRPWFVSAFYTLELDLLINRPCSIFGIQNAVPKLPPRLISDLFQLFPFLTAFPITFPVVLSRVSPSTLVTSSLCHWPSNSTTSIIILAFENVMQGRVSSPLVEVDNLVFTFSHCSPDIQNWVNKHKVQQNPEKTVASFTGTRQRLTLLHQVYSVITLAVVLNSPFPCSPTSPSLEKKIGFCHHLRLSTIRHCLSIHVTAVLVVTPLPFFFCLFTPALLQLPPCWPACCGTPHPSTHSECCGSSGVLGILGWSGHYPPFPPLDCLSPIVSLINLTVCHRLYHLQTKLPVTHCIRNWTITSCITYSLKSPSLCSWSLFFLPRSPVATLSTSLSHSHSIFPALPLTNSDATFPALISAGPRGLTYTDPSACNTFTLQLHQAAPLGDFKQLIKTHLWYIFHTLTIT